MDGFRADVAVCPFPQVFTHPVVSLAPLPELLGNLGAKYSMKDWLMLASPIQKHSSSLAFVIPRTFSIPH